MNAQCANCSQGFSVKPSSVKAGVRFCSKSCRLVGRRVRQPSTEPYIHKFFRYIQPNIRTGCWLWLAGIDKEGYGIFWVRRNALAHRWAYEYFIGPIPKHLELDHLCRVRSCANPHHVEAVTHAENVARSAWAVSLTCKYGHPFDIVLKDGGRDCRTCKNRREAERRLRNGRLPRAAWLQKMAELKEQRNVLASRTQRETPPTD